MSTAASGAFCGSGANFADEGDHTYRHVRGWGIHGLCVFHIYLFAFGQTRKAEIVVHLLCTQRLFRDVDAQPGRGGGYRAPCSSQGIRSDGSEVRQRRCDGHSKTPLRGVFWRAADGRLPPRVVTVLSPQLVMATPRAMRSSALVVPQFFSTSREC